MLETSGGRKGRSQERNKLKLQTPSKPTRYSETGSASPGASPGSSPGSSRYEAMALGFGVQGFAVWAWGAFFRIRLWSFTGWL